MFSITRTEHSLMAKKQKSTVWRHGKSPSEKQKKFASKDD